VVIKITFVMELTARGPDILFRLPKAVTPEVVEEAGDRGLQATTESVWDSKGIGSQPFTLQLAIEMADVIQAISSSTHEELLSVSCMRFGGSAGNLR
jgi:hypothetical protein